MAIETANIRRLPALAENRYKYTVNSTSDSVVYKDATGRLRQAFVFYNKDRETSVSVRDFPDGEFESPVNIHQHIGNGAELEFDNHNNTAISVAPDGKMFVAANHHVDPLRMACTKVNDDLKSFVAVDRSWLGTVDTDRITYPSYFEHRGYMCMSYREQETGGGKPRYRWILKRYNHNTAMWEHMISMNTGTQLRLYVSNIASSDDGQRIHMVGLWRNDLIGGTKGQRDLFHLFSDDGNKWHSYAPGGVEQPQAMPVTWISDGNSTVNNNIWVTPPDPTPRYAGSIAIDGKGYPHILMDKLGGTLVYHWFDGTRWQERTDILDTADSDIFMINGQPCCISHSGDRVFFHELRNGDPTTVLLAQGYVNNAFNGSVDRTALKHGWLSMMLTTNDTNAPGTTRIPLATNIYFISIPLSTLPDFSDPWIQ